MKKIILLLLVSMSAFAQKSYKFAVGSNITSFAFANPAGTNQPILRPSSGLHVSLSSESEFKVISKHLFSEFGISYNQFNSVGDFQNIPFSYSTDFISIGSGIGPKVNLGKGIAFIAKYRASVSKMVNGNQFLLNRYVDLSGDDQFNSILTFHGFSLELSKQISPQVGIFVKYQYLNTLGNSLKITPSSFSIGLSLNK